MEDPRADHVTSLVVERGQGLIGVPLKENGQEVTRYFVDEGDAATSESATRDALSVIGAWSDLDWDEMVETLDRIRHASRPTPPIDV